MRSTLLTAFSIACIALPAKSHEFWIEPVAFQIESGAVVEAHLRVGQNFEGASQSFIPRNFKRFEYFQENRTEDVIGVVGDRPAVKLQAERDGLLILVHQTNDKSITWNTWKKFVNFLSHKDAAWVIEEHQANGFPKEDVREVYSRYAKSLIAVGTGAGTDEIMGLTTEIVALENPYTGNMADGIRVKVFYDGEPRVSAQVEVFQRDAEGNLEMFKVDTNSAGIATIPVESGAHYMLDSVVLRPATDSAAYGGPFLWESLWANLTFAVP